MEAAVAYDHIDQARRRQRARVSQQAIASRLGISDAQVSAYESRGGMLSKRYALTGDDYERALLAAIAEREQGGAS